MELNQVILSRIPKVNWNLPRKTSVYLRNLLNIKDKSSYNLLLLSLTHKSYVNDLLPDESTHITLELIGYLRAIGADLSKLLSKYILYSSNKEIPKKDLDFFSGVLKNQITTELLTEIGISDQLFIGRGVKYSFTENSKTYQSICYQFVAGVLLIKGFTKTVNLVTKFITIFPSGDLDLDSLIIDSKSLLQEYTQKEYKTLPLYQEIKSDGPDHDKTFHIEVRVNKDNTSLGVGRSRKKAQSRAALNFLNEHCRDVLMEKISKSVPKKRKDVHTVKAIPSEHSLGVGKLAEQLGLTAKGKLLLSQSLIHKSYIHEKKIDTFIISDSLVQIGASLITILTHLAVLKRYLDQDSIKPFFLTLSEIGAVVEKGGLQLSDKFKIENLLLKSRGATQEYVITSIKLDAVKAMLAAIFIDKGHLETDIFVDWLDYEIDKALTTERSFIDAKTYLQELFQAQGKLDCRYMVLGKGKSHHQRQFTSTLIISSQALNERIKLVGTDKEYSKKAAEQNIAKSVVSLVEILNAKGLRANFNWDKWLNSSPLTISFLLRHELLSIPEEDKDLQKWLSHRLMGTDFLISKKYTQFVEWVKIIESLYLKLTGKDLDKRNIVGFYERVGSIIKNRKSFDAINYRKYVNEISWFLDKIDPETYDKDIKGSEGFKQIITLSQISKLITKQYAMTTITSVFDDFILLKRGRCHSIKYTSDVPDGVQIIEIHKGTFQILLEQLWNNINEKNTPKSSIDLQVAATFNERTGIVSVKMAGQQIELKKCRKIYEDSFLLGFIEQNLIGFNLEIHEHMINLSIKGYANQGDKSIPQECLKSFLSGFSSLSHEHNQISRILHDLKNQLLAFRMCIITPAVDRRTRLRNKFNASEHLNSAIKTCASAKSISKSLDQPTIIDFDLNGLLNDFISKKINSLPPGIRISPPKTNEPCSITSSTLFIESIIENIFKNSVEAISGQGEVSGEVSIDWRYGENDNQLLLEIKDDGPGIDEDTLMRILSGKINKSSKQDGSGIGMFTVKAMLDRIDGHISAESVLGEGCQWSIILNDFTEKEPFNIAEIHQHEKSFEVGTYTKESVI